MISDVIADICVARNLWSNHTIPKHPKWRSVTNLSTLGTYLGAYIYGTSTVTERCLGISQIKTSSVSKSSFMIKIENDCSFLEYLGLGLSS